MFKNIKAHTYATITHLQQQQGRRITIDLHISNVLCNSAIMIKKDRRQLEINKSSRSPDLNITMLSKREQS